VNAFQQFPIPNAQAFELDQTNPICKGLVSYIACLPGHGILPREFHPNGKARALTRVGTTGTELRGRRSTATGRGGHPAYPMATVSSGFSDAWTLNYGSNGIIDPSLPISLVSLNYGNTVTAVLKRAVRYFSGSTSAVFCDHGNHTESSIFAGVRLTDTVVASVATPAPTAGTEILVGYDYIPATSTQTLYIDGVLTTPTTTNAGSGANIAATTDICLGNNSSSLPFDGGIGVVGLWNRQLSAAEHAAIAANPYLPLRRARNRWFFFAATGPTPTGSGFGRGPIRSPIRSAVRGTIH